MDQRIARNDTLYRIQNIVIELGNKIFRTSIKRSYLSDVTPYIGNQWVILSRTFCDFVIYSPEVTRFYRQQEGVWEEAIADQLEQQIHLKSLDIHLSLARIYRHIEF